MKIRLILILITALAACQSPEQFAGMPDRIENRTSYSMDDYNALINSWDFFIVNKTEQIVIIDYYSAYTRCSRHIENALAIVEYKNDTIRIIDRCPGPKDYSMGDTLMFEPSEELLDKRNIGIVYIEGKHNPALFKYKEVLKTTSGQLRAKSE